MEKEAETVSLDALFKFGLDASHEIEDLVPQDPKYEKLVNDAIAKLERCTELVNQLHLFSVNESVDEIATPILKFILLPALLATFSSRKKDDRLLIIQQSEVYYKDFLKRCAEYNLTKWKPSKDHDPESHENLSAAPKSLESAARDRNAKIERYKEQQRLESTVLELEKSIDENKPGSASDEDVREYYLSLIRLWCVKAIDELSLAEQERAILEHMRGLPRGANNGARTDDRKRQESTQNPSRAPLKPFIITKSAEQKKVYGAGYPSLPVLSVDEFYEQKYGKGAKAGQSGHCHGGHSLQQWADDPEDNQKQLEREAQEKEEKIERDDPEELARQRAWDDWKDEHRRGEGNRKNMG